MGSAAAAEPAWRPTVRVLLWDEFAGPTSIAPMLSTSMPTATIDFVPDIDDLLTRVRATSPDIVFVAVHSPDRTALAGIERIIGALPTARVLAVGTRANAATMGAAVAAGARGFAILDREGADPVAMGVRGGLGARAVPPSPQRAPAGLAVTERELQILRGMSDGCSNLEIAKQLFVSEDTVKTHARRLFRKLGANDRAHAVALGMRYELVA